MVIVGACKLELSTRYAGQDAMMFNEKMMRLARCWGGMQQPCRRFNTVTLMKSAAFRLEMG